jgi:nitroreductase
MNLAKTTSTAALIQERRTIRKDYLDKPVEEEEVLGLLDTAVWAPNHGKREPWRFIFVPSERKQRFAEEMAVLAGGDRETMQQYFMEPAAYLIVVMPEDPRQKQWEEDFGAVSCLIQNFQLLAWEKQLGVVWKTNGHIYYPKVRELLQVKPGEKIVGFLHLGYFDEKSIPKAGKRQNPREKWTKLV